MKNAEQKISQFLQGYSLDSLPPDVVHETKRALLDTLGCMIAGLDTPLGQSLLKICPAFSSAEGASVIGCTHRVTPMISAFCQGYMANAHDADDGHRRSCMHAGGIIMPTVLAVGQAKASSGAQMLEAMVLGFEFAHRAGVISNKGEVYHGSAMGTTYGAAAAAGWLMGLSHEQIINAMGIVEMQAPMCDLMGWIQERRAPMIKEGMGWSGASGIMAALMAQAGITGTLAIFNSGELLQEIDTLGERFETLYRYYKPHPGCRWTHGPMQILLDLKREHNLEASQVERIRVRVVENAANLDAMEPPTMEDAQYSIPFILACGLVDGDFGPEQMTGAKLKDPAILANARKFHIEAGPEFASEYPLILNSELIIETTSGESYSGRSKHMRGDPQNPLSDAELLDKYRWMSKQRLTDSDADQLAQRIWKLEEEKDAADFALALHGMTAERIS